METKQHFLKMFTYDDWANREFLAALRPLDPPPSKVLRILAHTLSAQKLWLERLQRVPQSVAVWPTSTVEACSAWSEEMYSSWRQYLDAQSPSGFDEKIDYRNSKGEPFSSRVEDIITHVLIHSAYHRGQAALCRTSAGLHRFHSRCAARFCKVERP
jgi:uncharacterized damage-inducible protein DinB